MLALILPAVITVAVFSLHAAIAIPLSKTLRKDHILRCSSNWVLCIALLPCDPRDPFCCSGVDPSRTYSSDTGSMNPSPHSSFLEYAHCTFFCSRYWQTLPVPWWCPPVLFCNEDSVFLSIILLSETSSAIVTRTREIAMMLLMIIMPEMVITPWDRIQWRLISVQWSPPCYMSPGASWTLPLEVSWESWILTYYLVPSHWSLRTCICILIGQRMFLWTFYPRWQQQWMCLLWCHLSDHHEACLPD